MEAAQALFDSSDQVGGTGDTRHLPVDTSAAIPDEAIAALLPHGPVELVAEGGMALVYRGYDAEHRCPVAIKVLRTTPQSPRFQSGSFAAP